MGQDRCTLKVRGLDCPAEVATLRAALDGVPGVEALTFDTVGGTMGVTYCPARTSPEGLIQLVRDRAGMHAEPARPDNAPGIDPDAPAPWYQDPRWLATAGSGLALLIGMVCRWTNAPWPLANAAFALAVILGGIELVPRALRAAWQGRADIHGLMGLAVVGAVALGQWDEAATVAFLFGLSEAIEALSLRKARRAVRALLDVAPETAERIEPDGSTQLVDAREIQIGDRVRVRAGERIPVDGAIAEGRSEIDQRTITGESIPVSRGPGDEVFAGTVNGEGALDVEATRPLGQAVVSKIVEGVRAAQANRSPAQRSIERFAAEYTPRVIALALAVALLPPLALIMAGELPAWRTWIHRSLVVLVTACPCALVISTPVAIVGALAAAARKGILVKGGQFLEAFGRIKVLAFDKTGTLTLGEPEVVEVVSANGHRDADLLRVAAALGDRGGHLLGRAIARHARGLRLDVPAADDYRAVPGLGATGNVEGTSYHIGSHRYLDEAGLCPPDFHASLGAAEAEAAGTSVALTEPGGPLGWIRLADRPRPEAAAALAELRSLGIDAVMLTGDNPRTAAALAREVGLADEPRSGLLPADKARAIAELDAARGPAGMVGDGINDAPALAAASVSVAMGGIGSGASLEAADIVLLADDLSRLPWLVRHSRATLAIIRQNIALAVGSKAIVLAAALAGQATLWMAIAADLGVSLIVVANALRLLGAGRDARSSKNRA